MEHDREGVRVLEVDPGSIMHGIADPDKAIVNTPDPIHGEGASRIS